MATSVQTTGKRSQHQTGPKHEKKAKSVPAPPSTVYVVAFFLSELDTGSDFAASAHLKDNYNMKIISVLRSKDDANRLAIDYIQKHYLKYGSEVDEYGDDDEFDQFDDEDDESDEDKPKRDIKEEDDGLYVAGRQKFSINYDANGCAMVDEICGHDERHTRVEMHTVG
eukprot:TRINITY_DN8248_c2_g2_i1.p2 TRINITY_DN8248_c2_g2~~TRINITY_DN8248_c2_g2_i1.p2  ORF type:complete len:168 (+),score=66.07 TRINITY_DN8248_c2_g2_i1:470-973(+)